MKTQFLLKIVLFAISAYHLFLGLAPLLSDNITVQLAESVFGLKLEMTAQLSYMLKLLGVYAFVFGLICGVAAFNPERYRPLLYVIVLLYVFRVLNKFAFIGQFAQAFNAPASKVWIDIVLLSMFGAAVLLLMPRPQTPESKPA